MPDRQLYYVISKDLQYGNGIRVKTLEAMNKSIQRHKLKNAWTLVISIHGSRGVISVVGGDRRPNASGVYRAKDIKRIFKDPAFEKWRRQWGPNHVVLVGCQVEKQFEQVILDAFLKPKSTQKAKGLGSSCRPDTDLRTFEWTINGKVQPINSYTKRKKMDKAGKAALNKELAALNTKYGYFGAPPVQSSRVLHYYFSEEPRGVWPVIVVSKNYTATAINFWNRDHNARFLLKTCPHFRGKVLKGRNSKSPPNPQKE